MFEQQQTELACPMCSRPVRGTMRDGLDYTCPDCNAVFRVLVEEDRDRVAFLAPDQEPDVQPLHLPRGSIRATVAMLLSGTFWTLVLLGAPLPPSLLGVLLTILGAYFAFRGHSDPTDDAIYDPRISRNNPLNLPPGFIRAVLILGFGIAGVVLAVQGRLGQMEILEFYLLVVGLLAGLVLSRGMEPFKQSRGYALWRHIRAMIVILMAVAVAVLSLAGRWHGEEEYLYVVFCAVVTFYFGSRST